MRKLTFNLATFPARARSRAHEAARMLHPIRQPIPFRAWHCYRWQS